MAKLSAYGRTELYRFSHESNPVPKQAGEVSWRRITRALMSDRTVLEKHDVAWSDGQRHSYGWKKKGRLKESFTPEEWARKYQDNPEWRSA